MIFYKYRTKWSHGPSGWKLGYFEDKMSPKEIRDHFAESCNEYSYSEHFRGFEWKILNSVPKEYIAHLRTRLEERIKATERLIRKINRAKTFKPRSHCQICDQGPRCSKFQKQRCKEHGRYPKMW